MSVRTAPRNLYLEIKGASEESTYSKNVNKWGVWSHHEQTFCRHEAGEDIRIEPPALVHDLLQLQVVQVQATQQLLENEPKHSRTIDVHDWFVTA